MRKFTVACIAFAVMAVAGTASAQSKLGEAGQIGIASDFQLELSSTKSKPPSGDAGDALVHIKILPALDYFVSDGLSVGGMVGIDMQKQGDVKAQGIVIGPRVGYALALGDNLAFWPKLGIAYTMLSLSADNGQGGTTDVSGNKMTLEIFAPVTYSPAEHFYIGLGPGFAMDLSSKVEGNDANKDTTMGVMSQVGGWF